MGLEKVNFTVIIQSYKAQKLTMYMKNFLSPNKTHNFFINSTVLNVMAQTSAAEQYRSVSGWGKGQITGGLFGGPPDTGGAWDQLRALRLNPKPPS